MKHLLRAIVVSVVVFHVHGQDGASQASSPNASISGTVKDSVTGKPLANYSVSTEVNATWVNNTIITKPDTKDVKSMTDESGRYKLSDLPPGHYRIAARDAQHFGGEVT